MSYKDEYRERFSEDLSGLNELWTEYALNSDRRHHRNGETVDSKIGYREQLLDDLSDVDYGSQDLHEFVQQDLKHEPNSILRFLVGEFVTAAASNLDEDIYLNPQTNIRELGNLNSGKLFVDGDLDDRTGTRQSGEIYVNGTIRSSAGINMDSDSLILARNVEEFCAYMAEGRVLVYEAEASDFADGSIGYDGEGQVIVLNGEPGLDENSEDSDLDFFVHDGEDILHSNLAAYSLSQKREILDESGVAPDLLKYSADFIDQIEEKKSEKDLTWATAAEFLESSVEQNLDLLDRKSEEKHRELDYLAREVLNGITAGNVSEATTESLQSYLDDYIAVEYATHILESVFTRISSEKEDLNITQGESVSYPMERRLEPEAAQELLEGVKLAKIEENGSQVWGEETVSDEELDFLIEAYSEGASITDPVISFDEFGANMSFTSQGVQSENITENYEGFSTEVNLSWQPENMEQPYTIFGIPESSSQEKNRDLVKKDASIEEVQDIFQQLDSVRYRDKTSNEWSTPDQIPAEMTPEVISKLVNQGEIDDGIKLEIEDGKLSAVLEVNFQEYSGEQDQKDMKLAIEGDIEDLTGSPKF